MLSGRWIVKSGRAARLIGGAIPKRKNRRRHPTPPVLVEWKPGSVTVVAVAVVVAGVRRGVLRGVADGRLVALVIAVGRDVLAQLDLAVLAVDDEEVGLF